jgi:hypothetical protein
MHANELRIGNWYQNNKGEYQQITPRFFSSLAGGLSWEDQKAAGYSELSGYFHPIPLSPEILEKCGFEKDYNGYRLKDHMGLSFSVTKHGDFLACFRDKSLGVIVKHLHQLQNLFFALTGEELQINL